MMSKDPEELIFPIMTGFDKWWFTFITTSKPLGALILWPYIAWRTALTSVVPAWTTACAHILKPMKVVSIGSFVVLSRCSLKSAHIFTKAWFSGELIDWK